MAETAVGIVMENLVLLLVQEARLLKGVRRKVASIKDELEIIQAFLKDTAEKDGVSNVAKTWVKQVREEAFHIEDVIDEYIRHFAKQPHRQRQCRFLQKLFHCTIKLKPRHEIASEIQDISNNLKEKREMAVSYYHFNTIQQAGPSSVTRTVTWHDPRVASLSIEEAEVVGIESPKAELIKRLLEVPSERMVISVVGIGGLGKTTLVKKVYDDEKAHFGCHAWITVSQSYKMEELLRDMIKQFYKSRKEIAPSEIHTMKETSLIEELKQYLREKRMLLLLNNECSNYYVYKLPHLSSEKAMELFYNKVFQREGGRCPPDLIGLSHAFVERCEGLPLAIVAIGGLLSTKDKVHYEWCKLYDSLSSELKSNPRLLSITKILSLSYHDLPYNLKACFLYFGMFPEDYFVNCATLIRLWIAEGFVKKEQGITLEELAQDYLNQLIHRSLVQVEWVDFKGIFRTCRVHDMLHEIILSRSEELSLCLVSIQNYSNFEGIARRLSVQNNANPHLESITSSQTRSILILGVDEVPDSFLTTCFANFKLMKTMDFEGASIHYIPEEVGNLFHLKYLSLRDTKVEKLPKSIGKLKNLETLDLKRSLVSELPVEISGLSKLRYLAAYTENYDIEFNIDFRQAVKIHSGIGCLQSLQKLFHIEANNDALIVELGSLGQLRKLEISMLKRENGIALCTTLKKMSHLRSLEVSATSEEEFLDLQLMSSPPPLLKTLSLLGRLEKFPEWIPKLKSIAKISLIYSRLMDDPFKVLQALPNLMQLWLRDGYEGEQLHIEGGGFQKLKYLGFKNLRELKRLIIDEGSLPFVENLTIGPCPQLKEVPSGIPHLKSLKQLKFYDMPREFMLKLQPDEGPDSWKVEHIPYVEFWYRTKGENYEGLQMPNVSRIFKCQIRQDTALFSIYQTISG
uniref:Rx N-terminal domain-containing protein n=1 Tax=Fagus sylvatica TaxID=28930 RepID=A0A2N9HYD9_FAGSY